jgi:hypothetical protein
MRKLGLSPESGSDVLYVETIEISGADAEQVPAQHGDATLIPIGFFDTLAMLRSAVAGIGSSLRHSFEEAQPSELKVELNFGLKGDVRLIPVLLNGSGEGSIKVSMTWKKPDSPPPSPPPGAGTAAPAAG